ncbi:WD repeat, SAM and U-box domain-containing protein 1 [Ixodes scapularis]|uniref:WD repeat, SAM and U-box domain-containing protein 1 n=1 Tax=Ixodes scapularis TaxID=6945 RepID=UPI001A9FF381|nr:WD repeat, SAM and U-box domain-containing protein 1 [Ixodes scapularis]
MLKEWRLRQTLELHTGDVNGCDFSGTTLATCSNDKTVRIWNLDESGRFVESAVSPLTGHKYGVNAVQFSLLGTILASCSIDGTVMLWNAQTGEMMAQLQHPSAAAIRSCSFSPSGALLATGSDDETVIIWDISTRSLIRSLEGHEAMVSACAFSPDSLFLASGATGGDLKLWDARYGHGRCLLTRPEAHDLGVTGCHFSPQFEASLAQGTLHSTYILASCGNDDKVRVWRVQMGQRCALTPHYVLEGHTASVMCCRFSHDGNLLASSGGDKTIILWDAGSGELVQRLEKHSRYVPCCAFSSEGDLLATGSNDRAVAVWGLGEPQDHHGDGACTGRPATAAGKVPAVPRVATVGKWSVSEVCEWLEKTGLGKHRQVFEEQCINGQELLHLTHDSLSAALKIEALGQRNKLLREIQSLKNPLWRHCSMPEEDGSLPEEFYCPITQELMRDPVVAPDGYSYERAAITRWLESGKDTSPMTNETLEHTVIIPNRTLHLLIQKYLA